MIKTSDFMNLIQLKLNVQDSLENKGLKKPNIRQGAMEHIYQFMKDNKDMFLGANGDVRLPSDETVIKNAYKKYKGRELSSAEMSVINEMYRFV